VTLVLFALSMSFLFAIGGTALDARGMLARSSSMGCIAATVIGTVVLLTFFQMPAVKNARLLPQQEQVLIQPVEAPVLVEIAERPAPINAVDAYRTSEETTPILEQSIDYAGQIQSHLLNNSFVEARDAYLALASQKEISDQMQDRWETQALSRS